MATSSPPASPLNPPQRPLSALYGLQRSSSRMSIGSKQGAASRASDDDTKTSVKVGTSQGQYSSSNRGSQANHAMRITAVRIRPPLKSTDPGYELIPQRFQRSLCQVTSSTSLSIDAPQGRKIFVFDRVFGEGVQQEGVWEYVNESVEAFVQGYNVSVLAYGQSGSGKSYTMGTSGPVEQSDAQIMGILLTPQAQRSRFWTLGTSHDMSVLC